MIAIFSNWPSKFCTRYTLPAFIWVTYQLAFYIWTFLSYQKIGLTLLCSTKNCLVFFHCLKQWMLTRVFNIHSTIQSTKILLERKLLKKVNWRKSAKTFFMLLLYFIVSEMFSLSICTPVLQNCIFIPVEARALDISFTNCNIICKIG